MSDERTPIIIDADPGMGIPWADIDDNFAILLALFSEPLQLEMVSVVMGNTYAEEGGRSLRKTLQLVGRNVPSAQGATDPLLHQEVPRGRELCEQLGGGSLEFKPLVKSTDPELDNPNAVCELINRLEDATRPITLVPIGPLTNVALLLRQRPDLVGAIEKLVIMGGAVTKPGNVTPFAEFNFWSDPTAAHIVFDSPVEKVLVGLDVTQQVNVTPDEVRRYIGVDNDLGTFASQSTLGWIEAQEKMSGDASFHPHDPIAVSYLIRPELLETTRMNVDVDRRTARSHGRASPDGNTLVATGIDTQGFKELFFGRMQEGIQAI